MSETRCHVEFAQSARDDLRDILDWYESQGVPEVGTHMVLEIVALVRQLAVFPDSGKVVPELDTPWLRELEQPPFRIVYRRGETLVTVVRVWRSKRLMDSGLARNA